jgi:predicted Ser/Thr protein kinase
MIVVDQMPDRLAVGAVISGFRVQSLIGSGAMGSVYLAEETRTGELVALKVMTAALADDDRFRERFMRESALAASLEAPHVVRILTSGEAGGLLFLAMAYVEGADLRELLRREGRLDPDRALRFVGQVAGALDAAHSVGLVHRDVKPGNILIRREDEYAYVCDFGLARHVSSVSSLTSERGFVGTIDYVPPEQISGGTIDGRTDVYSLGCVLFECLTGARPFERDSELSVVFAHLNEPPPNVTDLRPELPKEFDKVFAVALAKSPEDRYRTCGDLAAAAWAASRGKTVGRTTSRRRRRTVLAAGLMAAAAAAIGGYLAIRGEHSHTGSLLIDAKAGQLISQTTMAGATLGHGRAYYKRRFGGFRESTIAGPNYPTLAFQQPEVAVYFAPGSGKAIIVTTWNRNYRTEKGIGPCSTVVALKEAYGGAVEASEDAITGKGVSGYVVGDNLFFSTQDLRTISAVALYRGSPAHTGSGSPQAFAGFIAQSETACVSS